MAARQSRQRQWSASPTPTCRFTPTASTPSIARWPTPRWSAGIALTYGLFLPMVWATGFDTGVVFLRRADFVAIGGYDETRHFAEDVEFVWKLLRLGWSRQQRLTRLRPVKAIASTRKFDRYGDWHYFTMMPMLLAGTIRARASDAPAARRYWYDDR